MATREILIDVSRLIWRTWRGGLATGIDRVCLAYVENFRGRAQAVVQRNGRHFVLGDERSDELFDLFRSGPVEFRRSFVKLAVRALCEARRVAAPGQLYLNLGHTGLDDKSLGTWVRGSGVKAVFFVHDLIPILHPEYCRAGEEARHRRRITNVLDCAAGVIANSRATLKDLAQFARSSGRRVPPNLGAPIAGARAIPGFSRRKFDRPHYVTVGTIEARKNHALLLHIWRNLVATLGSAAPLLVIVGQRGWEADNAIAMLDRAADLKEHVIELGRSDDEELAGLVATARALLMPSFAEGFGLPVAEALQLGAPVIASDLPVFKEFASDIPTYLDPLDGVGWKTAILSYLADCADRQRQLGAIQSYEAPDWPSHFDSVETWLQTLQPHSSR